MRENQGTQDRDQQEPGRKRLVWCQASKYPNTIKDLFEQTVDVAEEVLRLREKDISRMADDLKRGRC